LLDNGFLTIKEDSSHASPISSVFYEYYESLEEVENRLLADQDSIQCIVSNDLVKNSIPFGTTQKPKLWDYADGVDTIEFLRKI
jgi:WD40 repeat protein